MQLLGAREQFPGCRMFSVWPCLPTHFRSAIIYMTLHVLWNIFLPYSKGQFSRHHPLFYHLDFSSSFGWAHAAGNMSEGRKMNILSGCNCYGMSLHMLNYCDFRSPKVPNVLFVRQQNWIWWIKMFTRRIPGGWKCNVSEGWKQRSGWVITNRRKSADYTITQAILTFRDCYREDWKASVYMTLFFSRTRGSSL